MKFKAFLNLWLENYVKPSAKAKTVESYERIVNKKITDEIGEKEIGDITTLDIQMHVTELLRSENKATKKGLAPSSVNTVITVLQSSLRTAVLLGYAEKNVAEGIKRPKIKAGKVNCFTLREQRKIEQAVQSDKRGKMFGVLLCLYTGLRIGELLALTWEDVDLQNGFLTVRKTCHDGMNGCGSCRITDEPKTESSKRCIPVPKQLLPRLKQLKKALSCEYVISSGGRLPTVRSYQRSFALLLQQIGVEHKNFHALRHTFATRAVESGMDVKTLSEILGHKNSAVTLNRYVHSLPEHKQTVMNQLGKMLIEEP